MTRGKPVTRPSAECSPVHSPGTARCSRPGGGHSVPVPRVAVLRGGLRDPNLLEKLCGRALSPLPWERAGCRLRGSRAGNPSSPNASLCFAWQPGAAGLARCLPGQQQPGPVCERDCAECHQGEQEEGCGAGGGGGGPGVWEQSGEQEKVINQQPRSLPICLEGRKRGWHFSSDKWDVS